jgi:hypothetical protein
MPLKAIKKKSFAEGIDPSAPPPTPGPSLEREGR